MRSVFPRMIWPVLCAGLMALAAPIVMVAQLPEIDQIAGDPVRRALPIDGIASIDKPDFVAAGKARFIRDGEPVIGVVHQGEARAYPVWHLDRHEVVNDQWGNQATMVTW